MKLQGTVTIGGAKNATLALMPAALLVSGTFRFANTPDLRDVATMSSLLTSMGMEIELKDHVLRLDTTRVNKQEAPYEFVKKMRASIYVLGPLVARFGHARVSLPGGCAWSPRPVNLHIDGIRKLGAEVELADGYINAKAPKLTGAKINFENTKPVAYRARTGFWHLAASAARGGRIISIKAEVLPQACVRREEFP